MKATKRLINSVWTLDFEVVGPNRAKVIAFSRDDVEGYEKEKELNRHQTDEGEGRILKGFWVSPYKPFDYVASVDGEYYTVENPKHVFDYPYHGDDLTRAQL